AKIKELLLVDPSLDEERMADARLTGTTDENGDIRAMQKGLSGSFTYEEVKRIIETAQRVGRDIRALLQSSSDSPWPVARRRQAASDVSTPATVGESVAEGRKSRW